MDQTKVNRLKNILSGEYKSATSIHTGYEPQITHKEGDEWEENNKMYTIKNGIKWSITKFSKLRASSLMPIFCPNCNTIMNHNLDEKFWKTQGMCFSCVVKRDTSLIIRGEFDEFQRIRIINNILSYLEHREDELQDFLNNIDINQFITENGDIEDWIQAGMTKDQVREKILTSYNNMKQELLNSIEIKDES